MQLDEVDALCAPTFEDLQALCTRLSACKLEATTSAPAAELLPNQRSDEIGLEPGAHGP